MEEQEELKKAYWKDVIKNVETGYFQMFNLPGI